MEYIYQSIILHAREAGETDRIYTIYTREAGKIRAMGRGVRRQEAKLAGSLETITWSEVFVARKKGMGAITGAIPVSVFSGIKSNLPALQKVFFSFKSIDALIPEQEKDEEIFNLLVGYLETTEDLVTQKASEDVILLVALGFLLKLLDFLGYRTEVYHCVACERTLTPLNNYFTAARGGVLCGDCRASEARKIAIGPETIKLIRIILQNKLNSFSRLRVLRKDIENLDLIIKESLRWIIGS